MDWSVTINTVGGAVTPAQVEAVIDRLQDLEGVVSSGPHEIGATLAIDDMAYDAAVRRAGHRFLEACSYEGLTDRQIVEVRAVEWSRFGAQLEQPSVPKLGR